MNKFVFFVFILVLNLQFLAKADNIKGLEIKGISIGESALDFFTKGDIEKNSRDYYLKK